MSERKELALNFGALCDPVGKQLSRQGLTFDPDQAVTWQKCADAVTYLAIMGLLPDAQVRAARKRLLKAIRGSVKIAEESTL